MTSLPTSFTIGSASCAIASYRRAQYLVAGSTVVSASEFSDFEDDEDEARGSRIEADSENSNPRACLDSFLGLDWDEDCESNVNPPLPRGVTIPRGQRRAGCAYSFPLTCDNSREDSPLLPKKTSFSPPYPNQTHDAKGDSASQQIESFAQQSYLTTHSPFPHRRLSTTSNSKTVISDYGGKSTFGQTLFNSTTILLGIGMLSEPLAFAYSGWAVGTLLIVTYGYLACYTAKILAAIILQDPRLRSYSDIGRKAFGPRSTVVITVMFCLELFAVSVILVTLYADSLHAIFPRYSANMYKVCGTILLVPTVFLPLSLLSYTSILGIISIIFLVGVIFIDGFSKKEAPGSLWEFAPTDVGVQDYNKLGLAFGLFIAGFSGHAVMPSLARDMTDPHQFNKMINWAFVIATVVYAIIGSVGYMMFGNHVNEEISRDLLNTSGYSPVLNQIMLWMLVVSPLTKFGLNNQPLNAAVEALLGLDSPISILEDLPVQPRVLIGCLRTSPKVLGIMQRIFLTLSAVMVSILVPEFSSMMAFLGSFSAFMLCVVGPVLAKVSIAGRCSLFDGIIIVLGLVMAIWGTGAAFMSA